MAANDRLFDAGAPLLPYWLLFSVFAAGSLQYRPRESGSQSARLLWAAGLLTALMIGFRYNVGGDWVAYQQMYESVLYLRATAVIGMSDPGYMLLNWLAGVLGAEIWFVNLVCGLVFSWGLVRFANRQPNPWLAIAVAVPYLVIVVAMGYARQAVAIGIILAALSELHRSSLLRFALYVICAAAFHKSAVIVIPLVALAATRQRITNVAMLALTGVLLYYLFVAEAVDQVMMNYVGAEYSSQGAAIRISMNLPPAIIFLFYGRRFKLPEQTYKLWRNFALGSFVALTFLIFTPSSAAVDRISLYLLPLQIFVFSRIPDVFRYRGGGNPQLVLAVLIYSALVQFVWLNYAEHSNYWLPYRLYPLIEDR